VADDIIDFAAGASVLHITDSEQYFITLSKYSGFDDEPSEWWPAPLI
jgi:hypothetical protein